MRTAGSVCWLRSDDEMLVVLCSCVPMRVQLCLGRFTSLASKMSTVDNKVNISCGYGMSWPLVEEKKKKSEENLEGRCLNSTPSTS